MKEVILRYLQDRPGYIRPRLLPTVLNALLLSLFLGLSSMHLFSRCQAFAPWAHWLAAGVFLASLWGWLHFLLPRLRQRGKELYERAQSAYLRDCLLLQHRPELLPLFAQVIPAYGKTTPEDIRRALRPDRDTYLLCAEPDAACRQYLTHPLLRGKRFLCPGDEGYPCPKTELKGETLAWYARVLRLETQTARRIRLPAPLVRILRTLWVCGWFWFLSRWSLWGRDYYGMFCMLLLGCSLFWALQWGLEAHARRQSRAPVRSGASRH